MPPAAVDRIYSSRLYPPLQRALTSFSNATSVALFDVLVAVVIVSFATLTWRDARRSPQRVRVAVRAEGAWARFEQDDVTVGPGKSVEVPFTKAQAEAAGIVKNAERQIELETARALQQIRTEAVELSVAIASKLLARNLSKADNERLIEETFKQIEERRPS